MGVPLTVYLNANCVIDCFRPAGISGKLYNIRVLVRIIQREVER
jgi:hypothetical protein